MNNLNSIKLKSYMEENFAYYCDKISVDSDFFDSAEAFNNDEFGYITIIFEDTYDSIFCLGVFIRTRRLRSLLKIYCV